MDYKDSYQLGLYEKAMPAQLTWEERLTAAKEAGFDYIEMSIDETPEKISRLDWDIAQIEQLRQAQERIGLTIDSICLSAQRKYPLGSKKWETEACELMQKAVRFARKMGLRYVMLQGYDCYYQETSDETSKLRFLKNIKEGVMYAASQGVMLAIETMENDFMNTVEKAMRVIRQVDSPYLLVYPDLGNITNGTSDILTDIESGKGHIAAAHLKETVPGKFREIPYGTGQVNFPAGIAKFYGLGVRRYVAEFWHCGEDNWRQILADNRRFLDEQFQHAQELLSTY